MPRKKFPFSKDPWSIGLQEKQLTIFDRHNLPIAEVGRLYPRLDEADQQIANGHLLVSAPTMYHLLTRISLWLPTLSQLDLEGDLEAKNVMESIQKVLKQVERNDG